jgi:hypothetical protein
MLTAPAQTLCRSGPAKIPRHPLESRARQKPIKINGLQFAGLDGVKACVDVGGTKVAVSVAGAHGMGGRVVEPTVKEGPSDALGQQVLRMIAASCAAVGVAVADVSSVGVSSCGPFIIRDGCVELAAPNYAALALVR